MTMHGRDRFVLGPSRLFCCFATGGLFVCFSYDSATGRRENGKMKTSNTEGTEERRRTQVGDASTGWGVAPPRRREHGLFEGWGPTL
jgi:hypothetical protein